MRYVLSFVLCMVASVAFAAEDISGLWKTIDDETGEAKSIVQVYEYQGAHYGRVIKLFKNPDKTAVGIKGDPKIVGLDVIWNLKDEGERFKGGKILDPAKGKIYTCEAWVEGDKLIVRGKIGPFGRNQTWLKNDDNTVTALKNPVPQIPEKE